MTHELANEIGKEDSYNRTVIADAVITCSEFYQLKDASSGELIDGMEDDSGEEDVVHNVRFEVITDRCEDDDGIGRKIRSWKIVDVDDVLEGSVFY